MALPSKLTRSPATATGRPTSVAPARASACRLRLRPGARIGGAARITEGSGRSRGRWSKSPASTSQPPVSRPRCRRGTRPTGLVPRHPVGKGPSEHGDLRHILVAGGDHHGAATQVTGARPQDVAVTGRCQPRSACAGVNRSVGGELLEPLDDLHARRIRIRCLLAEQLVHPTRRVQPEGGPPLGAPALTDPPPLQDHMLHAPVRSARRCWQARLVQHPPQHSRRSAAAARSGRR
jgi:hypothetical protein